MREREKERRRGDREIQEAIDWITKHPIIAWNSHVNRILSGGRNGNDDDDGNSGGVYKIPK